MASTTKADRLYVTNNRVKQTFGLYSERNGMLHEENENIAFKDLWQVLDAVIETGGMSRQPQREEKGLSIYETNT